MEVRQAITIQSAKRTGETQTMKTMFEAGTEVKASEMNAWSYVCQRIRRSEAEASFESFHFVNTFLVALGNTL